MSAKERSVSFSVTYALQWARCAQYRRLKKKKGNDGSDVPGESGVQEEQEKIFF